MISFRRISVSKILIKSGTVCDGQRTFKADVLVSEDRIERIEENIEVCEGTVIDATGKLVLPGMIDSHTHYHLVSRGTVTCDSFEEGSRLAAFGGVTTVCDFSDHNRGESLVSSLRSRLEEMKGMEIDYTLHQGVYGHSYAKDMARQLEDLKAEGVKVLKIFTTYRETGYLLEDEMLLRDLFTNARRLGLLVTAHCEYNPLIESISSSWKGSFLPKDHADLRPSEAEAKAISFYGNIAFECDCPLYIVHVSSKAGLDAIRELRRKGAVIYAETTPTYLFLERSLLEGEKGSLYVMTPPLRTKEDNRALVQAVMDGEIDVIGSDHCSFTYSQKLESDDVRTVYPGIPGTEELFVLLHTLHAQDPKRFTLEDLVNVCSTNCARLFGLYPRKGCLRVGSDADVIIVDPSEKWVLSKDNVHTKACYTAFEGIQVTGRVKMTIRKGQVLCADGVYCGKKEDGVFLRQDA